MLHSRNSMENSLYMCMTTIRSLSQHLMTIFDSLDKLDNDPDQLIDNCQPVICGSQFTSSITSSGEVVHPKVDIHYSQSHYECCSNVISTPTSSYTLMDEDIIADACFPAHSGDTSGELCENSLHQAYNDYCKSNQHQDGFDHYKDICYKFLDALEDNSKIPIIDSNKKSQSNQTEYVCKDFQEKSQETSNKSINQKFKKPKKSKGKNNLINRSRKQVKKLKNKRTPKSSSVSSKNKYNKPYIQKNKPKSRDNSEKHKGQSSATESVRKLKSKSKKQNSIESESKANISRSSSKSSKLQSNELISNDSFDNYKRKNKRNKSNDSSKIFKNKKKPLTKIKTQKSVKKNVPEQSKKSKRKGHSASSSDTSLKEITKENKEIFATPQLKPLFSSNTETQTKDENTVTQLIMNFIKQTQSSYEDNLPIMERLLNYDSRNDTLGHINPFESMTNFSERGVSITSKNHNLSFPSEHIKTTNNLENPPKIEMQSASNDNYQAPNELRESLIEVMTQLRNKSEPNLQSLSQEVQIGDISNRKILLDNYSGINSLDILSILEKSKNLNSQSQDVKSSNMKDKNLKESLSNSLVDIEAVVNEIIAKTTDNNNDKDHISAGSHRLLNTISEVSAENERKLLDVLHNLDVNSTKSFEHDLMGLKKSGDKFESSIEYFNGQSKLKRKADGKNIYLQVKDGAMNVEMEVRINNENDEKVSDVDQNGNLGKDGQKSIESECSKLNEIYNESQSDVRVTTIGEDENNLRIQDETGQSAEENKIPVVKKSSSDLEKDNSQLNLVNSDLTDNKYIFANELKDVIISKQNDEKFNVPVNNDPVDDKNKNMINKTSETLESVPLKDIQRFEKHKSKDSIQPDETIITATFINKVSSSADSETKSDIQIQNEISKPKNDQEIEPKIISNIKNSHSKESLNSNMKETNIYYFKSFSNSGLENEFGEIPDLTTSKKKSLPNQEPNMANDFSEASAFKSPLLDESNENQSDNVTQTTTETLVNNKTAKRIRKENMNIISKKLSQLENFNTPPTSSTQTSTTKRKKCPLGRIEMILNKKIEEVKSSNSDVSATSHKESHNRDLEISTASSSSESEFVIDDYFKRKRFNHKTSPSRYTVNLIDSPTRLSISSSSNSSSSSVKSDKIKFVPLIKSKPYSCIIEDDTFCNYSSSKVNDDKNKLSSYPNFFRNNPLSRHKQKQVSTLCSSYEIDLDVNSKVTPSTNFHKKYSTNYSNKMKNITVSSKEHIKKKTASFNPYVEMTTSLFPCHYSYSERKVHNFNESHFCTDISILLSTDTNNEYGRTNVNSSLSDSSSFNQNYDESLVIEAEECQCRKLCDNISMKSDKIGENINVSCFSNTL